MPKITDIKYTIAGNNYDCSVWYTTSNKFFLKGFPPDGKPKGSGDKIMNYDFYKIIDHTPERENAFKELYQRFDKLLMNFINGFFEAEKFTDSIPTTKLLA